MGEAMILRVGNVDVGFTGELKDAFERGFTGLFARRYLPDVSDLRDAHELEDVDVLVNRVESGEFRVLKARYDNEGHDDYTLVSPVPAAYGSESPVFFLLQAVSRACMKKGTVIMTDSVGILKPNDSAMLLMGYPHTGKSTISALAIANGFTVLSTENTVLRIEEDGLRIVGGTDVLVYDPSVEGLYGVELPYDETTRSGYRILDISSDSRRERILKRGVRVEDMIILHASFNCRGASFSQVKGRKIKKVLWQFSTALIKGLDYYEPMPLDVPLKGEIKENLGRFLNVASKGYEGKILEAFGGHEEIFRESMRRRP